MIKLITAALLLSVASAIPAEAHGKRYHHPHYRIKVEPYVYFTQQPRIRISDHCVWKPWKNRTICKY